MFDLFMLGTCPYCQKVIAFLDKYGIKYNKTDISKPENLTKLLEIGGKEQVPFLYNKENNTKLYESDDIIEFVSKLKDTQ